MLMLVCVVVVVLERVNILWVIYSCDGECVWVFVVDVGRKKEDVYGIDVRWVNLGCIHVHIYIYVLWIFLEAG